METQQDASAPLCVAVQVPSNHHPATHRRLDDSVTACAAMYALKNIEAWSTIKMGISWNRSPGAWDMPNQQKGQ